LQEGHSNAASANVVIAFPPVLNPIVIAVAQGVRQVQVIVRVREA
jgi:hypothetical protein